MTQGDQLAFPLVETNLNGDSSISTGLSKRYYFALHLMSIIIINSSNHEWKDDAIVAIAVADALIEQLNK
jgi:hypothetical protein